MDQPLSVVQATDYCQRLQRNCVRLRAAFTLLGLLLPISCVPAVARISTSASTSTQPKVMHLARQMAALPLSFEANRGQAVGNVRFLARSRGYSVKLTDAGAELDLAPTGEMNASPEFSAKTDRIEVQLLKTPRSIFSSPPTGEDRLPGTVNYLLGNRPGLWHTDIPTYAKVRYPRIYPGVDLVYYGNGQHLEYDFIIAPGASPDLIGLQFSGARALRLETDGSLTVVAANGQMSFQKPVIYQRIRGRRQIVSGTFTLSQGNRVGFAVAAYNHAQPLIVDPVLVYSTYVGGNSGDSAAALAIDSAGNTYLTGFACSIDFPLTAGAFQTAKTQNCPIFVSKFSADGSTLLYSTYLGGSSADTARGLAVDSQGQTYLTGTAYSTDFPITPGALQGTQRAAPLNPNAFFTVLNATGNALVYSTYLGGTFGDFSNAIALDTSGNAYIAGLSTSPDFPVTSGAFQTQNIAAASNGSNAFVAKLNPVSGTLLYATYLGGSVGPETIPAQDLATAIAVDALGDAYVAGNANSSNFPVTSGAFRTTNAATARDATNAFVAKLDPSGATLIYSTYLGGSGLSQAFGYADTASGIAVDGSGSAYVTGQTYSADFPVTPGAFQSTNPASARSASNAFVTKFTPDGAALAYSTYLGGSGNYDAFFDCYWGDQASSIAVDNAGNAYIAGSSISTDFPVTPGALQSKNNSAASTGANAFFSQLNPDGASLLYSTYIGGSNYDTGSGLAIDTEGDVYIDGGSSSYDFPVTPGAYQSVNNTEDQYGSNAFLLRLSLNGQTTELSLRSSANPQSTGSAVLVTAKVSIRKSTRIPAGSVLFTVDGSKMATVTLGSSGTAPFTMPAQAAGKHTVVAIFRAKTAFAPSKASMEQTFVEPATDAVQFSPKPGVYAKAQTVTITDATTGAVIHYTTDGTTPTTSSKRYTAPISVQKTTTIKALSIAPGHHPSSVSSATYTIQ